MTEQDSPEDRERNTLMGFIESTAQKLGEYFNSVRIIATREAGQDTEFFTAGSGNLYAQLGSVAEWLEKQKEQSRMEKRDEWEGED